MSQAAMHLATTIDAKTIKEELEIYKNVKKDWFSAAVRLLPTFINENYLTSRGETEGATAYYRKKSVEANLKPNTLGTIKNYFQRIVEFRDAFRNIDLKGTNTYQLSLILKDAKSLHKDKKTLTLNNIEKAVNNALLDSRIKKSRIDQVETIDQQLSYIDALEIDTKAAEQDKSPAKTKAKTKADDKAKALAKTKADDKAKALAKTKADDKAKALAKTKADDKAKALAKTKAEDKAKALAKTKAEDEAKALAKTKAEDEAKALAKTKAEDEAKALAKTKAEEKVEIQPAQTAEVEISSSIISETPQLESSDNDLVNAYSNLDDDSKDFIGRLAASMIGDQTITILKSLDAKKQALMLEVIQRFK